VVWAALFIYLCIVFGGSSEHLFAPQIIKESKTRFNAVIADKERSGKAMDILDEMIGHGEGLTRDLDAAGEEMHRHVKDYHSTRGDFDALILETQRKREAAAAKMLDLIPELKRNVLREEWAKALAKPDATSPKG